MILPLTNTIRGINKPRYSRQRRGVRRQRCRGVPAPATPLSKAFSCPNAQPTIDSGVVGAKGLRLAPMPPHSTTLARENGGEAILADHRVKLDEKCDDLFVKFLLARIQKKGGR
ncbi:MAG: hypothetical protein ACKVY0_23885 [Prosthecobacter sp.]|uniref:hypothetical protein n=1 Tax=Prosthecobacter sp. TaxID=1965333 RepID=UPI0039029CDD